jgi:hypothetical protein
MKKYIILSIISVLILSSCVQKTHKRTVVFTLDTSGVKDIEKVGIRGWDTPLSWDEDYRLKEIVKDSLYQATVTGETGRICVEVKFAVNGKLELDGKGNRKIYFEEKDTVFYKAKFDQE